MRTTFDFSATLDTAAVGTPEVEHEYSINCWCCPRLELADLDDPASGMVVIHRSKAEAH